MRKTVGLGLVWGKVLSRLAIPTHARPSRIAQKTIKTIPISQIIPRELSPVDLKRRSDYFVDLIKSGQIPIAPILVQKLRSGKSYLIDGAARTDAYNRLGYTKIQAVISTNPTELPQIK